MRSIVPSLGFVFGCGVIVATSGCLGRTGIGADELEAVGAVAGDASVDAADGAATGDAANEANPDEDARIAEDVATPPADGGPTTKDSFIDIFDVFPIPESGVLGACAGCVRDNCGAVVNKCVNDAKCRSGITCAITKCLAGGGGKGGLDFACITGCFGGDFGAALTAINAFTCVTSKCGSKCGGLGGLPGGGGGGDGGGGGGGGGKSGGIPADLATPEMLMSIDPATRIPFDSEAFSPWAAELQEEARRQASCAH